MYDELVKSIHCCFGFEEPAVTDCENCMMKDKREEYNYEGCCDALGLAAADAIEELSKPKWIPVTERLPEFGVRALCKCRANIYEVLTWTADGWEHDPQHIYMSGFVTHWMPLPTPPKEE